MDDLYIVHVHNAHMHVQYKEICRIFSTHQYTVYYISHILSGWWFGTFFLFHFIYGMSSFPLTNSYFSRWLLHHQPAIHFNLAAQGRLRFSSHRSIQQLRRLRQCCHGGNDEVPVTGKYQDRSFIICHFR